MTRRKSQRNRTSKYIEGVISLKFKKLENNCKKNSYEKIKN